MSQHVPKQATPPSPDAERPSFASRMVRSIATHRRRGDAGHQRGQILIIFAFLLTILLGFSAFVVDLAWIWSNQLQVQRAADAGALAGVVHLPNNEIGAIAAANAETRKNGYTNNVNAEIAAAADDNFSRRMIVTVEAPVDTFFLGIFGLDSVDVTRTARAEYILPVPMGSPQNYLGVGRLVKNVEQPPVAGDWETPDATGNPQQLVERQRKLRQLEQQHPRNRGRQRLGRVAGLRP